MRRATALIAAAAFALGLAGCPAAAPPRVWPELAPLGCDCTASQVCPKGLTCMKGGSFAPVKPYSTCELACADTESEADQCPPGLTCVKTFDGPGNNRFRCQKFDR